MRVSKGGQRQGRLPILRDAALRAAPQDEVLWFYLLGIRFSQALGNPLRIGGAQPGIEESPPGPYSGQKAFLPKARGDDARAMASRTEFPLS